MRDAGGPSASADALVAAAMRELRLPTTLDEPAVVPQEAQDRQLLRVLGTLEGTVLADGLARWRSFCAVSEATEPIEDEVFTTRQSLRRAHAMLQAAVEQQQSHP